ncbi:MAG TPA: aromatic amino acid ammonia-lyase, partial [Candidatus Angelobacter sp.]|nr:aromatic amino acid ammonia-lyase [Candidatus Angelobacter sp.]
MSQSATPLLLDEQRLSIEDVLAIAHQRRTCELSAAPDFVQRIEQGARFLDRLLQEDGVIYGVTTGYGDSCTTHIPRDLVEQLPQHLYTFHGCGLGAELSPTAGRAVLAVRLTSLTRGYSGVSYTLLQQLTRLLQQDIVPIIPEEGSVGASGDLTPLSYVAAVLCGEREVYYKGERRKTAEVFAELDIKPLKLRPKEGLALMNGTAVMTALACLAYERTAYLAQLATRITALNTIATQGNAHHFDELLFAVKPHPGQQQVAAWLRDDLHAGEPPRNPNRLQDRYSLRCAPHVIGVTTDSLPWWRQFIENELNSANDNPIIDGAGEHVLHGGHFYGGHIAFVMDTMKNAVANIADLLDRQLAQLVDTKFNHGLPANLSGAPEGRRAINHGFKAVQIGVSAWTAEALKLTMPASVFSRSTECHNQDKVSMGTIAARDCLRVLQLTEQVAAAVLLAACQGLELRQQAGTNEHSIEGGVKTTFEEIRAQHPFLAEDRALEGELRQLIA